MDTAPAFDGLACTACEERFAPEAAPGRCPSCSRILDPRYDLDAVDLDRSSLASRQFGDLWRYGAVLPFARSQAVALGAGGTPLIDCPELAADLGVASVYVKDEGRNPTGSFKDRGQAVAVTAATLHGATEVALPTAGNAGQAAAAYAARAGLAAHVFVPIRAPFVTKAAAMVHGADVTAVEGGITDAAAAYEDAIDANTGWHSLATFVTPYRHEGKKTILYEVVEQLDWSVPDHVVFPTGGGVGIVGLAKAASELVALDLVDRKPALYAAQSSGCAPIRAAFEAGRDRHDPWEMPDTVCSGIAVPDPAASPLILRALRDTGGGAVATADEAILDEAVRVARRTGLEMSATAAAAASGARKLADRGTFAPDDEVVIVNTASGSTDVDVVRSRLASSG